MMTELTLPKQMSEKYSTTSNRSEIVFAYDAVDANPNGNPLSGANRPRVDPQTDQAIVTDVRLKRYLRDQLRDDGHGVYIRNINEEGIQATREDLLEARLKEIELDEIDEDDIEEAVFRQFLEHSADVRYFGATMSINMDEERYGDLAEKLPDHFTGPVQFSPGKSLHPVTENEEYNSLTSVIATGEGKQQGGFDLDDHRIQYAFIGFHGLVDEHGAEDTLLTNEDVRRLDTLCWRALKNQTITRSKVGQEPRLYLRVEYGDESFHLGGLNEDIVLDERASEPTEELRTVRDVCIDMTRLVDRLENASPRIDTVHVVLSDVLNVSIGGETGDDEFLYGALEGAVGGDSVRVIDVYEDAQATIPEE
jgi:CRISPR-associated protein Csh2